jgi:hypothetical protein
MSSPRSASSSSASGQLRVNRIQPDFVLDDLGRKAMTAIAERGHAVMLSDTTRLPTLRDEPLQRLGVRYDAHQSIAPPLNGFEGVVGPVGAQCGPVSCAT